MATPTKAKQIGNKEYIKLIKKNAAVKQNAFSKKSPEKDAI